MNILKLYSIILTLTVFVRQHIHCTKLNYSTANLGCTGRHLVSSELSDDFSGWMRWLSTSSAHSNGTRVTAEALQRFMVTER